MQTSKDGWSRRNAVGQRRQSQSPPTTPGRIDSGTPRCDQHEKHWEDFCVWCRAALRDLSKQIQARCLAGAPRFTSSKHDLCKGKNRVQSAPGPRAWERVSSLPQRACQSGGSPPVQIRLCPVFRGCPWALDCSNPIPNPIQNSMSFCFSSSFIPFDPFDAYPALPSERLAPFPSACSPACPSLPSLPLPLPPPSGLGL